MEWSRADGGVVFRAGRATSWKCWAARLDAFRSRMRLRVRLTVSDKESREGGGKSPVRADGGIGDEDEGRTGFKSGSKVRSRAGSGSETSATGSRETLLPACRHPISKDIKNGVSRRGFSCSENDGLGAFYHVLEKTVLAIYRH